VFYVTDLAGAKITAHDRIGAIKRRLFQALADKHVEPAEPPSA